MIDSSLFADRTHPARVLLDTMARTAAGLAADTDGNHPVCVELKRVAIAVQTEFQQDIDVFARHAAELDTFTAGQHLELQRSAQDYIAAAQRQEALDLAEIDATHALQAANLDTAPPVIADFLRQHWKKVLVMTHTESGDDSEAWRDARTVVADLLWSLEPRADPEDRKRLAIMVPYAPATAARRARSRRCPRRGARTVLRCLLHPSGRCLARQDRRLRSRWRERFRGRI